MYAESRWPMAAAVLAAMALTFLLPDDLRLAPRWVLPTVEGLLLLALIAGDPGRISRRSTTLRTVFRRPDHGAVHRRGLVDDPAGRRSS